LAAVHFGIRADGNLAAATQGGQQGAFRCDGGTRVGMVESRADLLGGPAIRARFNGQGSLTHGRAHVIRGKDLGDTVVPPHALEAGGGKHDSLILTLFQFPQTRVEIAA
jgi:hypothetical protein